MTAHPVADRYMRAFSAALERNRTPDAADITREIESHFAEAQAAGRPVDDILHALGPADDLARAYAVDAVINKRGGLSSVGGFLAIFSILFASGIVTMIVATALGSIGLAFTLSGVVLFVIGVLEALSIHLPNVQMAGLPPIAVIAMAPVFFALGWAALWALARYFKAMIGALRRTLPGRA